MRQNGYSNDSAKSGLYDSTRIRARFRQPLDSRVEERSRKASRDCQSDETRIVRTKGKWPLACISVVGMAKFLGSAKGAARTKKQARNLPAPRSVLREFLGRLSQLLWGQVRWKIAAIIAFTGVSAVLIALLAVAALNVVVRRESASVVEKQIQMLVQASRSVAPAILDHAGACAVPPSTTGLRALLAYTDEAFPQAQTYLTVQRANGSQALLLGPNLAHIEHPHWLPDARFTGLVV